MKWFLLSFLFFLSLLLLSILADDPNFLSASNREKLLFLFIDYLPWLLPLCCLCATLITLSFLGVSGEWLGLKACAVSWILCFRTFFLFGLGLTFLSWIAWQVEDHFLENKSESVKNSHLIRGFQMKIGASRAWYFETFNADSYEGDNLQLYCYDEQGNDAFRIRAKSASWSENGWDFQDGRFLGFSSRIGLPTIDGQGNGILWEDSLKEDGRSGKKTSPQFSKLFDFLKLNDLRDDPTSHLLLMKNPKSLTNKEISLALEKYPNQSSAVLFPFLLRSAQINCSLASCFLAIFCGLLIGVSNSHQSFGKIILISMLGIVFFYLTRTFFDSLGERGIVSHWTAASAPYGAVLLLSVLYWFYKEK